MSDSTKFNFWDVSILIFTRENMHFNSWSTWESSNTCINGLLWDGPGFKMLFTTVSVMKLSILSSLSLLSLLFWPLSSLSLLPLSLSLLLLLPLLFWPLSSLSLQPTSLSLLLLLPLLFWPLSSLSLLPSSLSLLLLPLLLLLLLLIII